MSKSPFDFVRSVSETKEDLIEGGEYEEREYEPYLTNRALSYHVDTVLYANEMNQHHNLDKKLQYDFYLHAIRKRKRYSSKWSKADAEYMDNLNAIVFEFNVSREKAKEILRLLSPEQIREIKEQRNNISG
jgi:hypothetical protein